MNYFGKKSRKAISVVLSFLFVFCSIFCTEVHVNAISYNKIDLISESNNLKTVMSSRGGEGGALRVCDEKFACPMYDELQVFDVLGQTKLFEEKFDNGFSNYWRYEGGKWLFYNNALYIPELDGKWMAPDTNLSNFRLKVKLRSGHAYESGIIFRGSPYMVGNNIINGRYKFNGYFVGVSVSGKIIVIKNTINSDGTFTNEVLGEQNLSGGKSILSIINLDVTVNGSSITVNSDALSTPIQITDSTYSSGQIGLQVHDYMGSVCSMKNQVLKQNFEFSKERDLIDRVKVYNDFSNIMSINLKFADTEEGLESATPITASSVAENWESFELTSSDVKKFMQVSCTNTEGKKITVIPQVEIYVDDDTAPTIPTDLAIKPNSVDATTATLEWTASTDNDDVAGYIVRRAQFINGAWSNYQDVYRCPLNKFTDTFLSPNTYYRYKVKAYDGSNHISGESQYIEVNTVNSSTIKNTYNAVLLYYDPIIEAGTYSLKNPSTGSTVIKNIPVDIRYSELYGMNTNPDDIGKYWSEQFKKASGGSADISIDVRRLSSSPYSIDREWSCDQLLMEFNQFTGTYIAPYLKTGSESLTVRTVDNTNNTAITLEESLTQDEANALIGRDITISQTGYKIIDASGGSGYGKVVLSPRITGTLPAQGTLIKPVSIHRNTHYDVLNHGVFDYYKCFKDSDIVNEVESGNVDMVLLSSSYPLAGCYEGSMSGRGAFYINGGVQTIASSRKFMTLTAGDFGRQIECFGHAIDNGIFKTDSTDSVTKDWPQITTMNVLNSSDINDSNRALVSADVNDWKKLVASSSYNWMPSFISPDNAQLGYGMHVPPNAVGDYGWGYQIERTVDSLGDKWQPVEANGWSTDNNTLKGEKGPGYKVLYKYPSLKLTLMDFVCESDIKLSNDGDAGSNAGVIFNVSQYSSGEFGFKGYALTISDTDNKLYLKKFDGTTSEDAVVPVSADIEPNVKYHVKIVKDGSNIKVWLGDYSKTCTIDYNETDPNFIQLPGAIGFRSKGVTSRFDNFFVNSVSNGYSDRWYDYPNNISSPGSKNKVDSYEWMGHQNDYQFWWFSHLPKNPGKHDITDGSNTFTGVLNNWWPYIMDLNRFGKEQITYDVEGFTTPPVTSFKIVSTDYNSVSLQWEMPPSASTVTGFRLYRNGTLLNVPAGSTTYQDVNLEPETTYTYTIKTYNADDTESIPVVSEAVTNKAVFASGFENVSLYKNTFDNQNYYVPYGWRFNSEKPSTIITCDTSDKISGDYSVKINAFSSSKNYIERHIPLKPHTSYVISGWMKTSMPQGTHSTAYVKLSDIEAYKTYDVSKNWTYFSKKFDTGYDSGVSLKLGIDNNTDGSDSVWFDDIRIDEDMVGNGGFVESSGNQPIRWDIETLNGNSILRIDTVEKHELSANSVKIESTGDNDAKYVQTVQVKPNTWYKLEGYVKTSNVINGKGACLVAECGNGSEYSNALKGTNDWSYCCTYFYTGTNTTANIQCRLGYNSALSSGTAWYDDICLSETSENTNFENVNNGMPSVWKTKVSGSDTGITFGVDSTVKYEGDYAAKISATVDNDSRLFQNVSVKPNTWYVLTGYIKTENVTGYGANIAAEYTNGWEHTDGITGTTNWQRVRVRFFTGNRTTVELQCRLGFYGCLTQGTAWFDKLRLFECDDNFGFERFYLNDSIGWIPWNYGTSFVGSYATGRSGSRSAVISSDTGTASGYSFKKYLEPNKSYTLNGYIKTNNVQDGEGAFISVTANSITTNSLALSDTNDWTLRTVSFTTGDDPNVEINCRLGGLDDYSTGISWFDDLSLVKNN